MLKTQISRRGRVGFFQAAKGIPLDQNRRANDPEYRRKGDLPCQPPLKWSHASSSAGNLFGGVQGQRFVCWASYVGGDIGMCDFRLRTSF